jgi:hypothetical protein
MLHECGALYRAPNRSSAEPSVSEGGKLRREILPWAQLPCNRKGSLTCSKSVTWDPGLYFPSEGRRAEDFYARKKSDGFGRV